MFTWVRLQQPQEQRYLVIIITSVRDVLVFTWVRLQQPQEQRYLVLPVCDISVLLAIRLGLCSVAASLLKGDSSTLCKHRQEMCYLGQSVNNSGSVVSAVCTARQCLHV